VADYDVSNDIDSLLRSANKAAARTSLQLGTSATLDVGTSANQVVQLTAAGKLPAVDGSLLTNLPGGDISKVGTPANDQVSVWTGDGTIEGSSALSFSATAGLGVTIQGNLTRSIALTLRNTTDTAIGSDPNDYLDEVHLVLQTGTVANHRRYINFKQYDGTDEWLIGVNAGGAVIWYDASSGHRLHMLKGGVSQINSIGADSVEINNYAGTEELGTGGLTVYSGGPLAGRFKRLTVGESNTDDMHLRGKFWVGGTDSTGKLRLQGSGSDAYLDAMTGDLYIRAANGSTSAAKFDGSSTAGDTRFFVYDVDNGTLERVTVGAANSGGAGFKVLRIPN
jgi:hypothetical protein